MEQWTGSKLGKEYVKTIFSPFLFSMQNVGLIDSQAGIKIA